MRACLLAFLAGFCVYASLRLASSCAALHTARINHALRYIANAVQRRGVRFECEPHVSRTEYSCQHASINYAFDVHCCCRPSTRCSFRMRVSCVTHRVPLKLSFAVLIALSCSYGFVRFGDNSHTSMLSDLFLFAGSYACGVKFIRWFARPFSTT